MLCSLHGFGIISNPPEVGFQMTSTYHKIIEQNKILSNIKLSDLIKPNLPIKIYYHIGTHTFLWDIEGRGTPTLPQKIAVDHMGVDRSSVYSLSPEAT